MKRRGAQECERVPVSLPMELDAVRLSLMKHSQTAGKCFHFGCWRVFFSGLYVSEGWVGIHLAAGV
jgi:hypothetical protein